LFPALILALAMIMAAEQLLANRFYESVGTAAHATTKATATLSGGVQPATP
jgi:cytochrome c oxidase assembly factor CtaG